MYKLELVKGIGKTTVERMKTLGIDSLERLASINAEDLLVIKGIGKKTAEKYIVHAKELLEKQKMESESTFAKHGEENHNLPEKRVTTLINIRDNNIYEKNKASTKLPAIKFVKSIEAILEIIPILREIAGSLYIKCRRPY